MWRDASVLRKVVEALDPSDVDTRQHSSRRWVGCCTTVSTVVVKHSHLVIQVANLLWTMCIIKLACMVTRSCLRHDDNMSLPSF